VDYFEVQRKIFAELESDRLDEARALLNSELVPVFDHLSASVQALFEYNMRVARTRSHIITSVLRSTQWTVALVVVSTFVVGFVFGSSRWKPRI
jgi:ABC-type transporter Mla maintaining outer membrane lipid asymmetry permease subunit MlaE